MADKTTENEKNTEHNSVSRELRTTYGQINLSEGTETQKIPVNSFSQRNIYFGLKLVSHYDAKKGVRAESIPKITASFNGQFVDVPISGKWWKEFASFAADMANVLDGVEVENVRRTGDVNEGRELMARFRAKE